MRALLTEDRLRATIVRAVAVGVCAGALLGASPAPEPRSLESAYLDGEAVRLEVADGPKPATVGPWRLGARVLDPKPRDQRLNLYIVVPGTQYHLDGAEDYDHNAIINALPLEGKAREYDVYWALALDPHLRADFRNERDLIVTAQARFTPGDLFEFDDIPADFFLRTFLKLDSLPELEKFRRRDRSLPRLIIVPAGFAISASAPPAATPAQ
jgi:hypothetical protein